MIKKITIALSLLMVLTLSACSGNIDLGESNMISEDGLVHIGRSITVDAPDYLTIHENNDVLAADGLYYTTWVTGNSIPYENADGETIDLYDGQVYFLTSESPDQQSAQSNYEQWMATSSENYDITREDTMICNNQTYTFIEYHCVSDDSPYVRGVSAFAVHDTISVCIEFTCTKDYDGDLTDTLKELLNNCNYAEE